MGKRTQIGYQDHERFIVVAMERAGDEGNAVFVAANTERLETLIRQLQDRAYELADLQYRARIIRDQHERAGEDGRGVA